MLMGLMWTQSVKKVKVDLKYPEKLHLMHNDYPLAPEKLAIPYDMLSDYCKKIADEYEIKVGDVKKLIPNLGNKTNYELHYRNLQLYLSLGMKLTKIHRLLKFQQSDWLKNILILTLRKEQMLLIVLNFFFSNLWSILFMAKQRKICETESKPG